MNQNCVCGSGVDKDDCCLAIISGERVARTAEELMRSRYTAFTISDAHYLIKTTYSSKTNVMEIISSVDSLKHVVWQGLKIIKTKKGLINDSEGKVEFIASFIDAGRYEKIHELSTFIKENGQWYYVSGKHY
jgi:SEC-C motif-containing protein